ncbi:hypothetical protein CR513_27719, partial [Mucuna pruriens]
MWVMSTYSWKESFYQMMIIIVVFKFFDLIYILLGSMLKVQIKWVLYKELEILNGALIFNLFVA